MANLAACYSWPQRIPHGTVPRKLGTCASASGCHSSLLNDTPGPWRILDLSKLILPTHNLVNDDRANVHRVRGAC